MCVALSFLFGYLLSTRCVCSQIGRAFEASIDHKTLLCDHMLHLAPFIAYFLKKNYSLRQNTLKNLRVWEKSLTSVLIGVYLDLIWIGTWLGTGSTKNFEDFLKKEWPDVASDSEVQHPVSSQEVNLLRKSDRTLPFSVWSEGASASGRSWRHQG